MIHEKKVCVVLPAYNAAKTLEQTYHEIDKTFVDEILLVDDKSHDETVQIAKRLKIPTIQHEQNRGYGGNQKTCYRAILERGADIIVMLHPDYQYSPKVIPAAAWMIASEEYDVVLGSRILVGGAKRGGMPLYKYVSNRFLTLAENFLLGQKLSEYHTGFRTFSRKVLQTLPLEENSDDFVFDNQILAQAVYFGFRIGEISCPSRYFTEASSINFHRSVIYGLGVLKTGCLYWGEKRGFWHSRLFHPNGKRLLTEPTRQSQGSLVGHPPAR